jgi:glycosyltransferase involved in cell wall biosynthesis
MRTQPSAPLVVLATDSAVPSGVGEHMLALARAIATDHRVLLAFASTEGGLLYLNRGLAEGFDVKEIGTEGAFSSWLTDIAATVLHVHAGIGWEGHGLVKAGRAAGVPIVRTEHLPYLLTDDVQIAEHRLSVNMADSVVFVSHAAAETYRRAGYTGSRFAIVQNGITAPHPTNTREATRRSLDVEPENPLIITVARFSAQKDYPRLIEAAALVSRSIPLSSFVFVGDGPDRAEMEALVRRCRLVGKIRFVGERDDVPDLLIASDLFVLPSRFEGLPLAVLEAMALGLPVVATRIGGNSEALGADYPWLVAPEDATALARTITQAIGDPVMRRTIAASNRRRFAQRFRAERMGRDTAALYGSILSQKAGAA